MISPIEYTPGGLIDITSTVNKLLTPQTNSLTSLIFQDQTNISDYGQLQSTLNSFDSALQAFMANVYTATPSTSGIISAVTSSTSSPGDYNIVVNQLAQSQTLVTGSEASASSSIGGGSPTTLTFQFGTTSGSIFTPDPSQSSQTITIDSSNNSLQGIANTINAANIGVTANVSYNGTGYQLSLTGNNTGDSNSMSISVSGDSTLQNTLSYVPGGLEAMTQTTAAQNASIVVNGVTNSSATNAFDSAIPGTTITASMLGTTNLNIAQDAVTSTTINNFVTAYNNMQLTLNNLNNANFEGNVTIANLQSTIVATLNSMQDALVNSPYSSLAQIGITTQQDGTLTVDQNALHTALTTNPRNVAKIFTNNGFGIADRLDSQLQSYLGSGGSIATDISNSNQSIYNNQYLQSQANFGLGIQKNTLIDQYTALNAYLSNARSVSLLLQNQLNLLA